MLSLKAIVAGAVVAGATMALPFFLGSFGDGLSGVEAVGLVAAFLGGAAAYLKGLYEDVPK